MLEVLQTLNALSSLPGGLVPVMGVLLLGTAVTLAFLRFKRRTIVATVVRIAPLQVRYTLDEKEKTVVLTPARPVSVKAGDTLTLEYNPAQPDATPRVFDERWYVPVGSMAGLGAAFLAFYFASGG